MPWSLNDYHMRLSDNWSDRLAFRMMHWLLSPGTSDVARLRGYLRVKAWRKLRTREERLRTIKVAAKMPARALREAREAVAKYGEAATREAGVSRWRQVRDLWWLQVRHGIYADVYYSFRLYRPEQLRRAPAFLQGDEDDDLFRMLNVRVAREETELLLDKGRFERWLVERGLPTVRTLAEFKDGTMVHSALPDGHLPRCNLFSKPNDSLQGFGTRRWQFDGDGWVGPDGRRRNEEELVAHMTELSRQRGFLVQEQLKNHPAMAPLAPAALSTVRVLTLRGGDGVIRVILAAAKIPTGTAPTDHMRLGGIAAPVDLATGRLGPAIRKDKKSFVARCERHPDTGAVIEGFQLPEWERVKQLAVRAHESLDRLLCVGWDVAILEGGPVLVEGNDNPGHTSSQLPSGTPFGETPVVPTLAAELRASFSAKAPAPRAAARDAERPQAAHA